MTLQSTTLEQELDGCYDRFQSIGDASDSVKMRRRSEEVESGLGTSGATVGSRPNRVSLRTLSSCSSRQSRSSHSVASLDMASDTGGQTVVPARLPGNGDKAAQVKPTGQVKRNPVPSASAERAKARSSKSSGSKSGTPLAKK